MLLSKKRHKLVSKVIDTWKKEGVVSENESQRLHDSIEISKFDWKRLAKYSFWIAGISLAISLFTILFDEAIMIILERLFMMTPIAKSTLLALGALTLYCWGFRRKQSKPDKRFSNEFLLFAGAILTSGAITFFGVAVDIGSEHYSILILMATIVYLLIGGFFPSAPMWILGLISLSLWFGAETGYLSGYGAYFLGMNYPVRFILFGGMIIVASFFIGKSKFMHVSKSTYIMGLLNLFLALWIMSIFGNYGDMTIWHVASGAERFIWSLLFGLAAVASIVWGLKNDDGIARGFGITFLFINLYTKYFEYFWDVFHKAIFFALLALSFWLLGRYSEKAFNALKKNWIDILDEDQ